MSVHSERRSIDPLNPPTLRSQAAAISLGQHIVSEAHAEVAKELRVLVTASEEHARKARSIDRWCTLFDKRQRNLPVRENGAGPSDPKRGWLASFSERRAKRILRAFDGERQASEARVKEIIERATDELLSLNDYGVVSPFMESVRAAVNVNGPRDLHFMQTCDACYRMIKARASDQSDETYTVQGWLFAREEKVPSTPRGMVDSLDDAVRAAEQIAATTARLTRRAHLIAGVARVAHVFNLAGTPDTEPTLALRLYDKLEAGALQSVRASLAGATAAIAGRQGVYPAAGDFYVAALDAVDPNKLLYWNAQVAALTTRALVRNRGNDAKARGEAAVRLPPLLEERPGQKEAPGAPQVTAASDIADAARPAEATGP